MQRHLRLAALPLLMLWAAGAEAAGPRITIAPITGDKRATVQSQISAALCKTNTCVSSTRVFTKKKPDWKKIQSANVQGLLVGGIGKAKSGGGKELTLSWLNKPGKAAQSWTYPLTKQGKLTTSSVNQLSGEVNNLATGAAAPLIAPGGDSSAAAGVAAAGAAVAAGVAASQTPPPPAPEPLPLPVTPTPPPATGEKTLADTPVAHDAGADVAAEGPRHQWRFAVELGVDLLNRNLSYDTSATLRPYSVGLFFAPHARLELYPIAFFSDGLFAGIGLFGDYALSVGLKSKFPNDTQDKGTSYVRWQGGLEWRLRFWKDSDFAIVPFGSYLKQKFTTDGTPSGIGFDGLPQFDLSSYRMGLRFDIPVSGSFWIIVGADYVLWTTKSVNIQAADGTNKVPPSTGSGHAIEAELGVNIGIVGPLSVRIFGFYSSTSFSFDDPTNNAKSATDRYLGGRVMLRLQF